MLEPTGLETHGPLGTFWVSLGLIAFYIALIWINGLLALIVNSMFAVPSTWLMDLVKNLKAKKAGKRS
jgi:hypothetical protein